MSRVILEHGLTLTSTSPRVCRKCKRYDRDPVVVGKSESAGSPTMLAFCRVCAVEVLVAFDERPDLEAELQDLESKVENLEETISELRRDIEDLEYELKEANRRE